MASEVQDKGEHIGEVSIAPSMAGLREFAREEIGIKAAAGGRIYRDPGPTAADFDLHIKGSKFETIASKTERLDSSKFGRLQAMRKRPEFRMVN